MQAGGVLDESRPSDGEDDFSTVYESVFGEFDPKVDYIRATNTDGHYEQLWVADLGKQVKVPPRIMFMIEKIAASPHNKLRNRNDVVRDCLVRGFHWRYEQEKDIDPVLASELEIEIRELALQTKLAYTERALIDDAARRDGIIRILSTPYSIEVEMLASELIAALKNPEYVLQCRRKLEDFCGHGRR